MDQVEVLEFGGDVKSEGMKCAVCTNAPYR